MPTLSNKTRIENEQNYRQGEIRKAYDAWHKQDHATAESGFLQSLRLDPTNATANYYYAGCIARRDANTLVPIGYARAVAAAQ